MSRKFYKHKLLFDENMPARTKLPRLNGLFNIKHIRDDLHKDGLPDDEVYKLAIKLNRLIVTFNGDDFRNFAQNSELTGIIHVSDTIKNDHIDTKLTSLFLKSS